MKCPFTPGECLGRECPGWSLGRCFLDLFLQKMDNLSLKLDTLCNLTSLTVASHAAAGKLQYTDPTNLDMEKDDLGQNIEKEPKEAGNQPTFWNIPLATSDHERRDTPIYGEAAPRTSSASGQAPEKRGEIHSRDQVKGHAKEPDRQPLQKGATFGTPPDESFEGTHHSERGDQAFIQAINTDKELLPVFPAKVSEFMFVDGTEPPVSNPSSAAQGIEPQELTLELTAVEEFSTTEVTNGLAVSERALLMAEPTNGAGPIDIVFDGIAPDLHGEVPPVEPKEAVTQPALDSIAKDLAAPYQEPASSAEEPPAETDDARLSAEVLSVERVIDDITSAEESAKTEAQLSDTAEEPEAPALTATPVAQTTAQPEIIVTEKVLDHPPETAAEPASFEEAGVVAGERDAVLLEATPVADEPTVEGATASSGQTPGNLPAGHAEDLAGAGSPSEVDATSSDPLATEPDIKVALEEIPESQEEVAHLTEPTPWEPIGVVEANGHTVLGIDFGAALSKVAVKTDEATPATAIPLALIAYEILHKADLVRHFESQNEYAEESLLYFDQNEFVFCGLLAKKLSLEAAEAGQNRPAIQNLKTFLVRGGANLQIHSDFFPASESLDSQSVLAIYLAYLLRLTRHYLDKRPGKITVDLDTTIRNFSIPMWIEDRYREDVKRLFRGAAAYAFCLERWLKDDLIKGARLPDVRKALEEARGHKSKIEEALVGSIVTESAAAGRTRLLSLPNDKARPLTVLAINVGAGFTDFALFSVAHAEGNDSNVPAHIAYKGGVGTGLGVWDNALKTLLFNRVREIPAARKKMNEFKLFKARLELQAREIKEALMASEESLPIDVSPVLPEPISIERSELESSLPVKAALFGIRDGLRVFIKEAIKAIGMHRFDPGFTEIIITGGGAFLPSVVDCIREAVATLGPAYPAKVRADFISPLYTSIPNIGSLYPLLAVSLGAAEKEECPEEQQATNIQQAAAVAAPATPSAAARPKPKPQIKMPAKGASRFRLT
jgi:hypothetical protein